MSQTPAGSCVITKIQYSPTIRVPINQQHCTTGRSTSLKLSTDRPKQRWFKKDTTLIVEPVANAEYTNKAGEFNGKGFNSLNEEEMDIRNQRVEDLLVNMALKIQGATEWAKEEIERAELEKNDKPGDNEGKLCKQEGLNKCDKKNRAKEE
jgi:hypothetical protein